MASTIRTRDSGTVRLLGRQSALDGVRAIAVLAVLGFHMNLVAFGAGYFGVDMFFVLSGFLITSLLLAERETTGRIDFKAFYARRALRLLPALVVLLTVVVAVCLADPVLPLTETVVRDAFAALFYVANWLFALRQDFEPAPLLTYTWSLSIEEQFYVVWPLLLTGLMLATRQRRSVVLAVAVGGFLASNALRWWMFRSDTPLPRLAFGTDVRAGPLLLGCAAGMAFTWGLLPSSRAGRRAVRYLGVLGAAALVWMIAGPRYSPAGIVNDFGRVYKDGYTLIALVTALIIVWLVVEPDSLLARALSWRPVVWVGRVSYGVYLFHVPVTLLVTADRLGVGVNAARVVQLALTFGLTTASYYLIERPFLRLKKRFERSPDAVAGRTGPSPEGTKPLTDQPPSTILQQAT